MTHTRLMSITFTAIGLLGVLGGCAGPQTGEIVFASARSGNGDLYVISEGASPRPLIATLAPEGGPRFDASRGRVVYQRFESDTATLRSGNTDLFSAVGADSPPAWSQDRIAYSARRNGREDIFIARPDGSDKYALTADDAPDRYPTWSPDGSRIAFARRFDDGWDIAIFDLREPEAPLMRLTNRATYIGHLAWSPDGSRLAFDTFFEDGNAEIAVMETASGDITRLTTREGPDLAPSWSLDGSVIAFAADLGDDGGWDVWRIELETGELMRLTDEPGFDGAPVFVPAEIVPEVK